MTQNTFYPLPRLRWLRPAWAGCFFAVLIAGCKATGNKGIDASRSQRVEAATDVFGNDNIVTTVTFAGWGSAGVLLVIAGLVARRGLTHKRTAYHFVRVIEQYNSRILKKEIAKHPRRTTRKNVAKIVKALGYCKGSKKDAN